MFENLNYENYSQSDYDRVVEQVIKVIQESPLFNPNNCYDLEYNNLKTFHDDLWISMKLKT